MPTASAPACSTDELITTRSKARAARKDYMAGNLLGPRGDAEKTSRNLRGPRARPQDDRGRHDRRRRQHRGGAAGERSHSRGFFVAIVVRSSSILKNVGLKCSAKTFAVSGFLNKKCWPL